MEIDLMGLAQQGIRPADIQTELNRIWESLKTTNTTRACLFNLVFYTEKNYRTAYIQRIAQNVVQKFPARVIFVSVDKESKEDYLKTAVSILPSSKGENDVACDFIRLEAAGTSQERIPFVVLPHLLSDLPVYLVWAEDPSLEDPLFQQLAALSHRLIFDSEAATSLPRFAASVLKYSRETHADVADLNWARIETWRDMLSSAFYREERLQQMEQIREIQILYNAQATTFFSHTRIQALYMQAWLACQLNWTPQKVSETEEKMLLTYASRNTPVQVHLIPVAYPQLPPGLILSLDITTSHEEHFRFQRNLESIHQVSLTFSSKERCDMPCNYTFAKAESGHSLVKEICHRGTSGHFIKVLNLFAH